MNFKIKEEEQFSRYKAPPNYPAFLLKSVDSKIMLRASWIDKAPPKESSDIFSENSEFFRFTIFERSLTIDYFYEFNEFLVTIRFFNIK